MRPALFLAALLLAQPALAAEKPVYKVDSVIATAQGRALRIEAKGAVESGGWNHARLKLLHSDTHNLTFAFVAAAPPAGMTVLDALVPVTATTEVKLRRGQSNVRVQAQANDMTTQVLH